MNVSKASILFFSNSSRSFFLSLSSLLSSLCLFVSTLSLTLVSLCLAYLQIGELPWRVFPNGQPKKVDWINDLLNDNSSILECKWKKASAPVAQRIVYQRNRLVSQIDPSIKVLFVPYWTQTFPVIFRILSKHLPSDCVHSLIDFLLEPFSSILPDVFRNHDDDDDNASIVRHPKKVYQFISPFILRGKEDKQDDYPLDHAVDDRWILACPRPILIQPPSPLSPDVSVFASASASASAPSAPSLSLSCEIPILPLIPSSS
jgi:hypothetical protein